MELNHDFQVSVPIEHAWAVLTDLERIAPCMPGAQLLEVEGDEYRGRRQGEGRPDHRAQYKGMARIVELDEPSHRAVLRAEGRETRGQGTAAATVTATLEPRGRTPVCTSRPISTSRARSPSSARGVLGEVSEKLLDQFVKELEASVLSAGTGGRGTAGTLPTTARRRSRAVGGTGRDPVQAAPGPRVIDSAERPPVDLLDAAGGSVLKRLLPLLGVLVLFASSAGCAATPLSRGR